MRAGSNCSQFSSWYTSYAGIARGELRGIVSLLSGILTGMFLLCLYAGAAFAQGPGQAVTGRPGEFDAAENAGRGRTVDGYFVQQSVELGGRITDATGNSSMYNTIVNLQSGPRVLEHSLTLQGLPGHGSFFDTLYEESFGWGGDPSNALRLRLSKRGIYDFTGNFRRDQNYFDYNLLANPLNNVAASPATPTTPFINVSPHSMLLTRRMYDFDLAVMPQRKFNFHFGFSRNRNEGPSFSSVHQGTEALLFQPYNTTENTFRFGANWRVLPRTTLSFNESLRFIKYDTDQFLFPSGLEPDGLPAFPLPTVLSTAPGANTFTSYSRRQRYRNFLPTEQLALNSTSIRHVDLTARYMYSNADADTPLAEDFGGFISRSHVSSFTTAGSSSRATWVSNQAEGGVTVHLTPNLRVVDSFRYFAYRVPGQFNLVTSNFFTAPAGGTVYTAASPPDLQNELLTHATNQSQESNEISLQWDFSRHVGGRVGYLYRHINDNIFNATTVVNDIFFPGNHTVPGDLGVLESCESLGGTVNPVTGTCTGPSCLLLGGSIDPATGNCIVAGVTILDEDENETRVEINQHWGIGGLWFRWGTKVHADAEVRIMSADNYLTRIDPRREQQYRASITYMPEHWLTLNANINMREQRNRTQDFAYNAHYRNFGFSAVATHKRFMGELSYMFSNAGQNANVCYVSSVPVPGSFPCVNGPGLIETLGFYRSHSHFGSASVQFRPVRRFVLGAGYSVVAVEDGSTLILHPLQPLGSLDSRYQQPFATIGVDVAKGVELRAGYNYYQYENQNVPFSGAVAVIPRYFHANVETFSLRYSF